MAVPALLGVASFVLAFAQRTGLATADTKINLHVDPGRFLSDVASMWTATGQLGGVQAGQQVGYLFPMGPFFALGHAIGLQDWVVQRLWLGTVLWLAAWGVVRLLDALHPASRGVVHLAAGAVTLLNPFVVTYVNRTTVTLLAYAALPWLLLVVHRGLRDSRSWRWPAACALLVAASGGGVNGAVTAWMLVGPLLLLLYEARFAAIGWRPAGAFLARTVPLTVLVSLWWVIPAYVQSSYGIDFLHFTEQPGTVWGTTSATESLRLMSFWLSYVGVGFAGTAIPYFDDARTLLFSLPVVVATLLLPAVALSGFVVARRWRYGPFFLALALVGVLIMMAGFPNSSPLRHGLTFTYNHLAAVRFLRASYKAAPLLALALACLVGAAAGEVWTRLGRTRGGSRWRLAAAAGGLALLGLAAWPLVTGRAQDRQVSYTRIPAAWRTAAADLGRRLPANARAVVLPGELFSFYTWGGTVDPILPALSRRPVAVRSEVPYADLRATDLLWTLDGLVHQQRLLPGQLAPLLGLIGARAAITATDSDLARSDAPAPGPVAAELAAQPGFGSPVRSYGPIRRFDSGGLGGSVSLPEVRRYDVPAGRGIVHVEPRAQPLVLDGSAAGLAGLAAFGALPADRPILYAADLTPAAMRTALRDGGQLVISDSNRRRAFVAGSLDQNVGPTLAADQSVSADGIMLDPFGRGPDFETVASYTGVGSVQAPASPQTSQFPEHRPFAAIDGSLQTAWLADPTLDPGRRALTVTFERKLDVPHLDLAPYGDAGGVVRSVEIAGRTYAVHPGWNRLPVALRGVRALTVSLARVSPPRPGDPAGAGGITELRIPGVSATERLRLPVDGARAIAGAPLEHIALSYLFERTTGDDPYRRDLAHGPYSARRVHDVGDAEQFIRRRFDLPADRSFGATAWVNPFAQTPDDVLDRLAGDRGAMRVTSSARLDGAPGWRGSRAFDGDPRTAWIGDYDPARQAWLQWSAPSMMSIRMMRLLEPTSPVRQARTVRLVWPGGATGPLAVGTGGVVSLPRPLRARTFRLEILSAAAPAGASAAQRRAVGVAEVQGVTPAPRMPSPTAGAFAAPCGTVRVSVGAASLPLRVAGSAAAFDSGRALPAYSCGRPVPLSAGTVALAAEPGPFAIDELRLFSPAPSPLPPGGGRATVLDSGTAGRGSYDHVRVSVGAPSWLVLGEGYDRGWRAWCDGRSLGRPVPIDGYANGWPIGPGCRNVHFAFAPNTLAAGGYLISAVAALACVVLLIAVLWHRRDDRDRRQNCRQSAAAPLVLAPVDAHRRVPLARALLWALPAGAAFAFVFGLAAGLLSVPAIAIVLSRGVGVRPLVAGAGILLGVVVPVLYVAAAPDSAGGNHYGYASQHMAAHWAAVAAIGLLIAALGRSLQQR